MQIGAEVRVREKENFVIRKSAVSRLKKKRNKEKLRKKKEEEFLSNQNKI